MFPGDTCKTVHPRPPNAKGPLGTRTRTDAVVPVGALPRRLVGKRSAHLPAIARQRDLYDYPCVVVDEIEHLLVAAPDVSVGEVQTVLLNYKLANPVVIKIGDGSDTNTTATATPEDEGTIDNTFTPNNGTAASAANGKWNATVTAGTHATFTITSNGIGRQPDEPGAAQHQRHRCHDLLRGQRRALLIGSAVVLMTKYRMGPET